MVEIGSQRCGGELDGYGNPPIQPEVFVLMDDNPRCLASDSRPPANEPFREAYELDFNGPRFSVDEQSYLMPPTNPRRAIGTNEQFFRKEAVVAHV